MLSSKRFLSAIGSIVALFFVAILYQKEASVTTDVEVKNKVSFQPHELNEVIACKLNEDIACELNKGVTTEPFTVFHDAQRGQELNTKVHSITATEILYPEEYDFGDITTNEIITTVGKPIELNAIPITEAKEGDIIEIEVDDLVLNATVTKMEETHFKAEETNENKPATLYFFGAEINNINNVGNYSMHGGIGKNIDGIIKSYISINLKGTQYKIHIYKNVGYIVNQQDSYNEFKKRGFRID